MPNQDATGVSYADTADHPQVKAAKRKMTQTCLIEGLVATLTGIWALSLSQYGLVFAWLGGPPALALFVLVLFQFRDMRGQVGHRIDARGIWGREFPGGMISFSEISRVLSHRLSPSGGQFVVFDRAGKKHRINADWLVDPNTFWRALKVHAPRCYGWEWNDGERLLLTLREVDGEDP